MFKRRAEKEREALVGLYLGSARFPDHGTQVQGPSSQCRDDGGNPVSPCLSEAVVVASEVQVTLQKGSLASLWRSVKALQEGQGYSADRLIWDGGR
jgi:hypothetical protein